MPYLYTCPHCQTKTQVEDRYSGQAGTCVTCGGHIELPHFAVGVTEVPKPTTQRKAAGVGIAAVVAVILIGCLIYAVLRLGGQTVTRITSNRDQSQSIRNLESIAQALNAYAADNGGSYPPPMTVDASNRPLHSWRVLILPYLGEEDLYNQFDLSVGWDDPKNMQVGYDVPSVYEHPRLDSFYESAYFLVVGKGTLFPAAGPLGPDSLVDDPSQTILVIEGKPSIASGMWTEPIDLDFSLMTGRLGSKDGVEAGGLFDDGVAMATVDERGHFVPNSIEPITFRSLVTPAGGERLPDDTLD